MKKLILGSAIALLSTAAIADYNVQVEGTATSGGVETLDYSVRTFDLEYAFNRIDTSSGPVDEAAFLGKATTIGFSASELNYDNSDDTESAFNLNGRYVSEGGFIVLGNVGQMTNEFDGSLEKFTTTSILVGFGAYMNDTNALTVNIATTSGDTPSSLSFGLDYHGVFIDKFAVNTGLALYDVDGVTVDDLDLSSEASSGYSMSAGLAYYPIRQLSLGVDLTNYSGDNGDGLLTSYTAKYYFMDQFAAALTYSNDALNSGRFAVSQQNIDGDSLSLSLTGRF